LLPDLRTRTETASPPQRHFGRYRTPASHYLVDRRSGHTKLLCHPVAIGRQLDTAPGITPNPRKGIKIKTCQGPSHPERAEASGPAQQWQSARRISGLRLAEALRSE